MKFANKKIIFLFLLICGVAFADEWGLNGNLEEASASDFIETIEPYFSEEADGTEAVIIIETSKPKLEVYLNGVYQGKTRLQISGLLPGEYKIELKKKGQSFYKVFVTVKRGYILTYRFE